MHRQEQVGDGGTMTRRTRATDQTSSGERRGSTLPSCGAGAVRRPRWLVAVVGVASLAMLGGCGGDDAEADATPSDAGGSTEEQPVEAASTADPDAVATCLEAAGYATSPSSEVLSDAQLADQLELFGQTEALTFDAASVAFAGGVSFYESPEQAEERAEALAGPAKAQRVVGNALINIEAGSDFEEAVDEAEACLTA